MARLTVRLPETLHQQLIELAEDEGVSLNQYIVYSLTRQAKPAYVVTPARLSPSEQQREYQALVRSLRSGSDAEVDEIFAEREPAAPEEGLTPEIVKKLREGRTEKVSTR